MIWIIESKGPRQRKWRAEPHAFLDGHDAISCATNWSLVSPNGMSYRGVPYVPALPAPTKKPRRKGKR